MLTHKNIVEAVLYLKIGYHQRTVRYSTNNQYRSFIEFANIKICKNVPQLEIQNSGFFRNEICICEFQCSSITAAFDPCEQFLERNFEPSMMIISED